MSALLAVEGLCVHLGARAVVDDVGFSLAPGEALGIVGESGSGKSQTALALLGLCDARARVHGSIRFDDRELLGLHERELRRIRGAQIAAVFQNPGASLNPHLRIGTQLAEGLRHHRGLSRSAAMAEVLRLLDAVRIADAPRRLRQYPHELSGGMCQRVALAMALACAPRLLIADEPTTALDATTQARLLDLMRGQCRERGLALLLISHDLGVVAELCSRVLVMRAGRVVEHGAIDVVMSAPRHPYTAALLAARRALAGDER
ncbi:ABC transporter ATP-binding protein [Sinimarinibacterium thermocellulolyticum]|uniref:ABC-type dipeptide transporter n=1 Tax=Sinimarinibacterium thermocellulolyticum TaxID=3170016 RepID=A0ABV2A694_9GAMM